MTDHNPSAPAPRPAVILAGTFCAVVTIALVVGITHFFFPNNIAFETGQNPVTYSQLGLLGENRQLLHMSLHPFTGYHGAEDLVQKYRTNNLGFISKYELQPFQDEQKPKSSSDRLLVLTGGGAVWGWGASSSDTVVAQVLENELNRIDVRHHWKVLGLAAEGWIAYQEYLALNLYGSETKPDWVVTLDGRNDIVNATTFGEPVPGYFLYTAERRLNDLFDGDEQSGHQVLNGIMRYRALSQKLDWVASKPQPDFSDEALAQAMEFYLRTLRSIAIRFSESHILFITQAASRAQSDQIYQKARAAIVPQVQRFPSEYRNVSYLNAQDLFSTEQWNNYFVDDEHMNDKGHQLLAVKIAQLVLNEKAR